MPDKTNDNTMLSSTYALERLLSMLQTAASASVANYDNQSVQTVDLTEFSVTLAQIANQLKENGAGKPDYNS